MKKISIILSTILATVLLFSCESDIEKPVLTKAVAPKLLNPDGTREYVLSKENAASPFETFIWEAADYGLPIVTYYTVQLDAGDGDFSNPLALKESTTQLFQNSTVAEFNQRLLDLGFTPGETQTVQVRVMAANQNSAIDTLYSDPITLSVVSYDAAKVYPKLYVPGNYQVASGYGAGDWDPSNDKSVIWSVNDNGKFEGYIYFGIDNAEWKLCENPDWSVNWGDDGADGTLDQNGANIQTATAGYYRINTDMTADPKTYTIMRTDWGVIGSATPTGWDSDTKMTFDTENLYLTLTMDLVAGEIKFRANDDWALNYGMGDNPGELAEGGPNIPVDEDGNYTIILDLSQAVYTYTLIKN
ncbi:MAG: SusF/SusE family outer membrane protein [Chlorobi bacterium]|nr:SusF/SusE family outer membrane protein [Chlorobiota bacterium]